MIGDSGYSSNYRKPNIKNYYNFFTHIKRITIINANTTFADLSTQHRCM